MFKETHTKENLLSAAIRHFKVYGYSASSISKICESAAISKATLYHYFKSKTDLLSQIVGRQHGNFQEKVLTVTQSEKEFLEAMVNYFIDNKDWWLLHKICCEVTNQTNISHQIECFFCDWEVALEELMSYYKEEEKTTTDKAREVIAQVNGFLMQYETHRNARQLEKDLKGLLKCENQKN